MQAGLQERPAQPHWREERSGTSMTGVSDKPARWSNATVYPDMWVDPDDDPRNNHRVSPDGELATLKDYLTNYRLTLRMKCEGLDVGQLARRSVPPSTMSLLGLLRHLAEVERDWRSGLRRSRRQAGGGRCRVRGPCPRAGRDRHRAGRAPGSEGASGEGRDRREGTAGAQDRGVRPALWARRPVAGMHRRARGAVRTYLTCATTRLVACHRSQRGGGRCRRP